MLYLKKMQVYEKKEEPLHMQDGSSYELLSLFF